MAARNLERRREILTSVYRLVGEAPYEKVSLSDIAREAGINKSLLQRYYPQKIDIVPTLSQLIPENDPRDQLYRLTMLESSANVTTKSVIAEHMYPIMIPHITRRLMLRVLDEISSTNPIAIIAPAKAETIIPKEPILRPFDSRNIRVSATVSFAPEEMPSTNGPTIGLSKNV